MTRTRRLVAALGLALAGLPSLSMAAVAWPEKPVRPLIPWAPGGSTDVVGCIISPELTKRLKQTVIVDNRPGAGSILGMHLVAAAPPDGYTFMLTSTAYGHLLNKRTGTDIVHVPFQGGGPAAADTMAGNPQINLGSVPTLIGYIRGGRMRALGVGATKRNPQDEAARWQMVIDKVGIKGE